MHSRLSGHQFWNTIFNTGPEVKFHQLTGTGDICNMFMNHLMLHHLINHINRLTQGKQRVELNLCTWWLPALYALDGRTSHLFWLPAPKGPFLLSGRSVDAKLWQKGLDQEKAKSSASSPWSLAVRVLSCSLLQGCPVLSTSRKMRNKAHFRSWRCCSYPFLQIHSSYLMAICTMLRPSGMTW